MRSGRPAAVAPREPALAPDYTGGEFQLEVVVSSSPWDGAQEPDARPGAARSSDAPDDGIAARPARAADPTDERPGPDFSSAYEGLDEAPVSVYEQEYVTPAPEPVVMEPYQRPMPAPLHQAPPPMPQQLPPHPNPYGYGGYQPGYGQVPPPVYQPQPYAQPYPYSYLTKPEHPNSTTIGVLGLASLVVGLTAPIAWYMGSKAKREIANGAPYTFGGLAAAGYIIGIIWSSLMIFFVLLGILGILAG